MAEQYTKARFWKCALQVNPHSYYEKYRGQSPRLTPEEYNHELLRISLAENIKVIGIANHGNVDEIDAIRSLFRENGIVVFPGFEIASSEKIHFVCLFHEDTTTSTLHAHLGACGITDFTNGEKPASHNANQIIQYVTENGGFVYAAHCTAENGLLFGTKFNNIWTNPQLRAAQIPGTGDDLKSADAGRFYQIIFNKNPDYKREQAIAPINAKDVEQPETLRDSSASCLIKMTVPGFESFKQAFFDPKSRVRLNSDRPEQWYSVIEKVAITGGYLDGLSIDLSDHLNAVIGGRGAGKSTLLECMRYALDLSPISSGAKKSHDNIVKENLGKDRGLVEVTLRSAAMQGRRFTVTRRHGQLPVIKDEAGAISSFSPRDLLPHVEVYGQNEIYEIAQDALEQHRLLSHFLRKESDGSEDRLQKLIVQLQENRAQIVSAAVEMDDIEQEVRKLPKLLEQKKQFSELNLEDKLKDVSLWEKERQVSKRVMDDLASFEKSLGNAKNALPNIAFMSDANLEGFPHSSMIQEIRTILDDYITAATAQFKAIDLEFQKVQTTIRGHTESLDSSIKEDEEKLTKAFKDIPDFQGRSGGDIGGRFKDILKEIERIRPLEAELTKKRTQIDEIKKSRIGILDVISQVRSSQTSADARSVKGLNRKLEKKLRITLNTETNRAPLSELLLGFGMEGVGSGRLAWIESADSNTFSPISFAAKIREGADSLKAADWGITDLVANALCGLSPDQVMQIEEISFMNAPLIELNVAHDGTEEYREINHLSKGQQCTAILHLLLLSNDDPLIVDQPEDNLDNAFIADRIVRELRDGKIKRQFLFATHNANIPVFGDAEWIGVFRTEEDRAVIPSELQGAIDVQVIKTFASDILEGGKEAFLQRKWKYGFEG